MILDGSDKRSRRRRRGTTTTTTTAAAAAAATASDHSELMKEMKKLLKVPMEKRMAMARERRKEQVKRYENNKRREGGGNNSNNGNDDDQENDIVGGGRGRGGKKIRFDSRAVLFQLVNEGDVSGVRALITNDNSLRDVTNYHGMTALHQSCVNRNLGLIHVLVRELSADLSAPDLELWTPLHTVALLGYADVAKFLLDNGADALALNVEMNMPYDICEDLDTLNIIETHMVTHGATQEKIEGLRSAREAQMLKDIRKAFGRDDSLVQRGPDGETLLHVAASLGHREVVRFLLSQAVVSVDDVDKDGWQAVHCASYWNQLGVVELLMEHGANILARTNENETALDLCRDDSIKDWMQQKAALENQNVKKASSVKRDGRRSSIDHGSSHFDSLVSLTDLNKFTHSSKRLNAEKKEEKKKKDVHLEYQSRLRAGPVQEMDLCTPPVSPASKDPPFVHNVGRSPVAPSVPRLTADDHVGRSCSQSSYVSIYNSHVDQYDTLDTPTLPIPTENPLGRPHRSHSNSSSAGSRDPHPRTPTDGKQGFVFPSQTSHLVSHEERTFLFPSQTSHLVSYEITEETGRHRSNGKRSKSSKKKSRCHEHEIHASDRPARAGSLTSPVLDTFDLPRRVNSACDVSQNNASHGHNGQSKKNKNKDNGKKGKPHLKCTIS